MTQEHPFAGFIRTLGKGKKGTRDLTREEAREAMAMILAGDVEPVQLGAFLMLMRVKEEAAPELSGFADAVRDAISAPAIDVDLDWATYAGKRRRHPWYVLSALALANSGVRVFMHGSQGHTTGRLYAQQVLEALNVPVAGNWSEVGLQLKMHNFAYLPLDAMSPVLGELMTLKPLLGLRSPVHTLSRMLNPLQARCAIDGVFHPPYGPKHQLTAQLLGTPRNLTLKGDGGEAETRPDSESHALWMLEGELSEEHWPRLVAKRLVRDEEMKLETVVQLWRGDIEHEYGSAAVISTLAITLKLLGREGEPTELFAQAESIWQQRDRRLMAD
ncbi:MAG: glycosyl transferase family protein [Marinobacterium sp.]|nr:glycosyl transferase family protein [Marinobacterium sp.]